MEIFQVYIMFNCLLYYDITSASILQCCTMHVNWTARYTRTAATSKFDVCTALIFRRLAGMKSANLPSSETPRKIRILTVVMNICSTCQYEYMFCIVIVWTALIYSAGSSPCNCLGGWSIERTVYHGRLQCVLLYCSPSIMSYVK